MATEKLAGIPSDLPAATTKERDVVYEQLRKFMGPIGQALISINLADNPKKVLSSSEDFGLKDRVSQITKIPSWEKGLASKPELKAKWDAYFRLINPWVENLYARLDEKNKWFGPDLDASDESREVNGLIQQLSDMQAAIDFAAQDAISSTPGSTSSPAQPDDVKKAIAEIDQRVQSTRDKLKEIASRGGASEPGPRLKGVFSAFKMYVGLWEEGKPEYSTLAQVPVEATKKALDGFARDAETAWSNDNPGKTAPPARAESSTTPPKSEKPEPAKAQAPSMGGDTWLLVAAVGLGAAALFFGKKR